MRRICLIAPNEGDYSQTFVADHIRCLPFSLQVLYGGEQATPHPLKRLPLVGAFANRLFAVDVFPNRRPSGDRLVDFPGKLIDLLHHRAFAMEAPPVWHRAFKRFLRYERIDAVLAEFGWSGVKVARACRELDMPLVVHFHGADAYKADWAERYRRHYARLFTHAAAVVAVSKDMVSRLESLGAPRQLVRYNPCGVDPRRFYGARPAASPPHFLYVGRFVPKKGPDLVIRAFARAQGDQRELELTMIGDGELLAPCQRLASELGIARSVRFLGVQSHRDVAAAMRDARALLQHSVTDASGDREGTPLVVLEAGCAGLPVIGTRHGGVPDVVVDGATGLLSEEGDLAVAAQHIRTLASSPDLAAALGERARRHVSRTFSLQESIAGLARIIRDALRARPGVAVKGRRAEAS